jgi:hypothetical protein
VVLGLVVFGVSAIAWLTALSFVAVPPGNRVLDMIVYRKGGQEFLLTANNSRGVMKIPTTTFASAKPITGPVESETAGVPFEKVASMIGIEQLDKLDDTTAIVIARTAAGGINLQTVPLP